jgi:hypothetical protein
MSEPIWTSEAIRVSDAVCFDVKTNSSVVLGLFIGQGEVATDHHLTPEKAMELADALTEGATRCLAARGA